MTDANGNPQATARDAILERIRHELGGVRDSASAAAAARDYRVHGTLDRAGCLDLFLDRLVDYDAVIVEAASETELAPAIASALEDMREQSIVVAVEFPREWLPSGLQVVVDTPASIEAIDSAKAVITTCEVAVASTGTIILQHVGAQGRRVITLLPDHHICLVRRDQVVELLPEALALLNPTDTAPLTTISGPSATSDIEMTRIRGVHGPRRLTVVLYG